MQFDLQVEAFLVFVVILFDLAFQVGVEEEDLFESLLAQPVQSVIDDRIVADFGERLTTLRSTLVDS